MLAKFANGVSLREEVRETGEMLMSLKGKPETIEHMP
jgi:hypothetical protein